MSSASCSDLYGDEDEVGEDSRQRCVSQNVAGVDDAHDEDDRHTHHKRGKDDGFKQLVPVARQNIDHLAREREKRRQTLHVALTASTSFSIHLSVRNAALHPQRDDFLKGHRAEGALQADGRSHVDGPHQGDEEGFAELCEEERAGQADAVGQRGIPWILDVLQDLIDQNSLREEREAKKTISVLSPAQAMASTSWASEGVFQFSPSSLALLDHQLQEGSDSFTGPRKAATMAMTPAMADTISLVLWKRTITRTNEAFSRPTFATSSCHSFWSLNITKSPNQNHLHLLDFLLLAGQTPRQMDVWKM